jgi:predicted dehydrogenase
MSSKLRLAIVGCGAITRIEHLPAAMAHPEIELTALVDSDLQRAEALKKRAASSCEVLNDWKVIAPRIDAILNALPNHLHAPVTLEALNSGLAVLCEKPLAINAADAIKCAETAEQRKLVLAIGMSRRFVASNPLLDLVLKNNLLGSLLEYDWQYGGALDWKSASGFYFNREFAGGGVLIDLGVHLLDGLIDWFGPATVVDYEDDNWGSGIEANCLLRLEHNGPYGKITGRVRLSRTFALKNRLLVRGSEADAEIPNHDLEQVLLRRKIGGCAVHDSLRLDNFPNTSAYYKQLDNFVQSIHGQQKPVADGRSGVAVIQCIEKCYSQARRIPEPWSAVPLTEKVHA